MSKKEKELKQSIKKAMEFIVSEIAHLKTVARYKNAPVAKQAIYKTISIAMVIANRGTDTTIDEQGSLFYASHVSPQVDDIISAVNEEMPIDIDGIRELVFPLWVIRHRMVMGNQTPWDYAYAYDELMPAQFREVVKEFMEVMADK